MKAVKEKMTYNIQEILNKIIADFSLEIIEGWGSGMTFSMFWKNYVKKSLSAELSFKNKGEITAIPDFFLT